MTDTTIWYEFDKNNGDHCELLQIGTVIKTNFCTETITEIGSNHGSYFQVKTNTGWFSLSYNHIKQIGVPVEKGCENCRFFGGWASGCRDNREKAGVYDVACESRYNNNAFEPILKPGMKMYVRSDANKNEMNEERGVGWISTNDIDEDEFNMDELLGREVTLVEEENGLGVNTWEIKEDEYENYSWDETWLTWKKQVTYKDPTRYTVDHRTDVGDNSIDNLSFVFNDQHVEYELSSVIGSDKSYLPNYYKNLFFAEMKPGDSGVIVEGQLGKASPHLGDRVIKTVFNSVILIDDALFDGLDEGDLSLLEYKVMLDESCKPKEVTTIYLNGYEYTNLKGLSLTYNFVDFIDECCDVDFETFNKLFDKLVAYKKEKERADKEEATLIKIIYDNIEQDDLCKYCLDNTLERKYSCTANFMCEGRFCDQAREELIDSKLSDIMDIILIG